MQTPNRFEQASAAIELFLAATSDKGLSHLIAVPPVRLSAVIQSLEQVGDVLKTESSDQLPPPAQVHSYIACLEQLKERLAQLQQSAITRRSDISQQVQQMNVARAYNDTSAR